MDLPEVLRQLDSTTERLRAATERAHAVRGTARSEDGLVTVTVDWQGGLVDVSLDPRVRRSHTADSLGPVIVGVTRGAAADAASQVSEIWAELYPDGQPFPTPQQPGEPS